MSAPSLPRRYLVAGVATVGLVGGGVVVANAATTHSSGSSSASPSSSSSTSSSPSRQTPPTPKPHIDGTVVGVSGDTITVKDPDGFTREIEVSSSTTYTLAGKTSSLSAVTKGRFVHGDGTVDSNGVSLDATKVAIMTSAPKPGTGPAGRGRGPRPAGAPKAGGKAPSGSPAAPKPSSSATTHGS